MATPFVAIGFTNCKHKHLYFGAAYSCHVALGFPATVSVLVLGLQCNTLTIQACLKMIFGRSPFLMSDLQRFESAEIYWSAHFLSDVDLTLELSMHFRGAQAHRFEVR